jgi:branched-chain amino acid transport system substrate-binding protein
VVGNTTLLSGQFGFIGEEGNQGLQLAIDDLNNAGGVHGRKIKVISYDDAYDTAKAVAGARRLVEQDQIFAWVGGIGTPTYAAAVPLLEAANVPGIAPYAPARAIGTMEHPLTYNVWTNFIPQFRDVVQYLIDNKGLGSSSGGLALVHFPTDHGKDALEGVNQALAKINAKVVADIEVATNEEDFASIALDLKKSGAGWVGMQLGTTQGGALLLAMRDIGFKPGAFGQSDFIDESFRKDFPEVSEGFYGPLQIRPLNDPNLKLQEAKAYYKQKTSKEMTSWSAIGYVQGLLAVEALKRMATPTRECLIEALRGIQNFETGILPAITFGPETRQGVTQGGVFQIVNGEIVVVAPFR